MPADLSTKALAEVDPSTAALAEVEAQAERSASSFCWSR
jgi:hypothetical protein